MTTWRKLILGLAVLLSATLTAWGQGITLPIVTKRTTGLTLDVSGGKIPVGGTQVTVAPTTVIVAGTGATCTRPAFAACDIVYANNAGVVAATPTIATAIATGNTLLAFVTTAGGNVSAVYYPWFDPRSEPTDVTGAPISVPWSSIVAPTGNETLAMGTYTTSTTFGDTTTSSPVFKYTFGAVTGSPAATQFSVLDTTGSTTTGPLVDFHTVGTSTALPIRVTAQGTANGVSMDTTGALSPIGTGVIAPRLNDVTALAAAKTFANTTFPLVYTWTNPAAAANAFSLSMGTATGASHLVNLSDGAANTGTGYLLNLSHGAASLANDIQVTGSAQTGSPSNSQINFLDTTGNTNTGPLVNIHTVGTSTALPIQVTAQGTANGVAMTTAGLFQKIGTGSVKADASTAPTDGYFFVGPEACSMALTTGTFAANPANSGGLSAPALVRAASGNTVLQLTTTAAANTTDVVCEINVPSRLTSGKGITITAIGYLFGYQTTALSSIGTAGVNSITYPAAGGAAAGTVASIGGVLTVTAGTNHGAPGATTTSGQCYSEKLAFGTPYAINVDTTRLAWQNTFVQAGASATVMQICGTIVYYTNQVL